VLRAFARRRSWQSPGDVRRQSSPVLAGIHQSLANFLFLSRCMSPGDARRDGLGQILFC
ncbi:hypothetical protein A2U01_0075854, partial [Trifolium medium]|nr:hypothetical protein [Trifolium medium]